MLPYARDDCAGVVGRGQGVASGFGGTGRFARPAPRGLIAKGEDDAQVVQAAASTEDTPLETGFVCRGLRGELCDRLVRVGAGDCACQE